MRLACRPWIQPILRTPHDAEGMTTVAEHDSQGDVADGMSGRRGTSADGGAGDDHTAAEPVDIRHAFRQAIEKHSSGGGTTATGEHAEAAEDEAPETRRGTATTESADGDAGDRRSRRASSQTTTADTGLITDEEFTALSTKFKDDPAALRRELEKTFTQKSQKLAADRRSLERLSQYTDLIDALEDDTTAPDAIRQLATEFNVKLGEVEAHADRTDATAEQTAEAVQALVDDFKADLGPELEYLGDGLAPAIEKLVTKLMGKTLSQELAPVKAHVRSQTDRQAQLENDQIFADFEKQHADWKQHEDAMFELSKKLQPGPGMTELEYLEALYTQVTAPKSKAEIDKRVNDEIANREKKRQQRSTRSREEVEERVDDAPADRVVRQPAGLPTLRESFAAAKEGVRW